MLMRGLDIPLLLEHLIRQWWRWHEVARKMQWHILRMLFLELQARMGKRK
jgi:hypothetical protein